MTVSLTFVDAESNLNLTVTAPEDKTVLETSEFFGVNPALNYSCRAGQCTSCVGRIVSGSVLNAGGSVLDSGQIALDYCLTCVAIPNSDCVIKINQEAQLNGG